MLLKLGTARVLHSILPSLLFFCLYPPAISAQQVGSFFTAIYLNGAPVASNQESCSNMGQAGYCCGSGQSCAWDDSGHVACCASGSSCHGSPYSGANAGAGQYQQSWTPSSTWQPQQTPAYNGAGAGAGGCNCGCNTCGNCQCGGGNSVVPIVPVSYATLAPTTSYYQVPTSTWYPQSVVTTTTAPGAYVAGAGAQQQANTNCPNGYTTVTEAHVGQPVRTVGCNVIIDSGGGRIRGRECVALGVLGVVGVVEAVI